MGVNSIRGFESPPLRQFPLARFLATALLCLLPMACEGPALTIRTNPGDAVVYLDNVRLPSERHEVLGSVPAPAGTSNTALSSRQVPPEAPRVRPLPYYGTLRIEAEHKDRLPAARRVTVAEPVTPWVFPFDFVIELVGRLAGPGDIRVYLPLPAADSAPPAPLPPKELLRARAAAAAVRR